MRSTIQKSHILHLMSLEKERIWVLCILYSSGYSKVFKGTFRGQTVAIKVLDSEISKKNADKLTKELFVQSSVRSPNIVYFFGATLKPKICLVMEFCQVMCIRV